jgi:hypothetical protein
MTSLAPPLHGFLELVSRRVSGEFVCVSPASELHFYLQAGRLAWATDSGLPFAFGRYLLEHTSMSKETFQEVLESCRRDRLPLGETLISWEVVTLDEIRAALRHQIDGALATLRRTARGRTIFLERQRQYATYDTRLTFDVEELLPRALPRQLLDSVPGSDGGETDVVRELRARVPEATWIELVTGDEVVEQDPPRDLPWVPDGLLARTALDGAETVVLRTARGAITGAVIDGGRRSLWCGVTIESKLGAVVSSLHALAGFNPSLPPASTAPGRAAPRGTTALDRFLERAPEVLAVFVLDGDEAVMIAGRADVDPESMLPKVRRRLPVLRLVPIEAPFEEPSELEELGYRLRSAVTGEPEGWCFGAELGSDPERTAWVVTERRSAQGLGWAYLTSLVRQLESSNQEHRVDA